MNDVNLTAVYERVLQGDVATSLPPATLTVLAQLRDRIEGLEHATLAPVEAAIAQYLQAAGLLRFDETSLFEQGERRWLHSASTQDATYYFPHVKHGTEGIDAAGVLPAFHERAVHDHWAAYQTYRDSEHAFCNAHQFRELDRTVKEEEAHRAGKMRNLLCRINARIEEDIHATPSTRDGDVACVVLQCPV